MDRYEGKPFLKLLDFYVLKAIGRLNPENEEGLRRMQPLLAKTFQSNQPWDQIVAEQMDFPETYPAFIREMWDGYQAWARENDVAITPETFTFEFMERYFPDIVNGSEYKVSS